MQKTIFMKYLFIFFSIIICVSSIKAQHNYLGKSQEFITLQYKFDPEYTVKIDTINKNSTLITCKTFKQYPYYTYEIDIKNDICISYAFVSKNNKVLEAYIDVLDHIGEIVEQDNLFNNFTYKIESEFKTIYYSIKKPFVNSEYYSRRNIYYIIISEELKE